MRCDCGTREHILTFQWSTTFAMATSSQEAFLSANAPSTASTLNRRREEEIARRRRRRMRKNNKAWKRKLFLAEQDRRLRTAGVTNTEKIEFKDFRLKHPLLMGIFEKGWKHPSPVQKAIIPIALAGNDIVALAKNGTGKNYAYSIPCLERIDAEKKFIQAMIIVPNPELALQTSQICVELSKHLKLEVMVTTDDTDLEDDIMRLSGGVQVLIGTPRRILDLIDKNVADVGHCKMLILDEADKLLSRDLNGILDRIIAFFPKERQIILYSAMLLPTVKQFMIKHLHEPFEIDLMELLMRIERDRLLTRTTDDIESAVMAIDLDRLKLEVEESTAPNNAWLEEVEAIRYRLESIIQDIRYPGKTCYIYRGSKLFVFGSQRSNVRCQQSDIDMVLFMSDEDYIPLPDPETRKNDVVGILWNIYNRMIELVDEKEKFINSVTIVPEARVPIVKIALQSGIDVDICVEEFNGPRFSELVRLAKAWFKPFQAFYATLKAFFNKIECSDSFSGYPSASLLFIMALHHLQTKNNPVFGQVIVKNLRLPSELQRKLEVRRGGSAATGGGGVAATAGGSGISSDALPRLADADLTIPVRQLITGFCKKYSNRVWKRGNPTSKIPTSMIDVSEATVTDWKNNMYDADSDFGLPLAIWDPDSAHHNLDSPSDDDEDGDLRDGNTLQTLTITCQPLGVYRTIEKTQLGHVCSALATLNRRLENDPDWDIEPVKKTPALPRSRKLMEIRDKSDNQVDSEQARKKLQQRRKKEKERKRRAKTGEGQD